MDIEKRSKFVTPKNWDIRISPETGRPVYPLRCIGGATLHIAVCDLITDRKESILIHYRDWIGAKHLNEMEILAWCAR